MKPNPLMVTLASLLAVWGLMTSVTVSAQPLVPDPQASEAGAKRLFILAGQSNMTGGLKAGFARVVEDAFGKENITIAHQCKPGRGIRFWDKDFRYPDNFPQPDPAKPDKQHGENYPPLLDAIINASKDKSFDTVTLVWMQGESDGIRGLGEAYERSFLRLLERLKSDLNRKEISFVIGRISDANMDKPGWIKVREVQMKLGEEHARCGWIDTDDLNGGEAGKPGGELHYPHEQIGILGERFAAKVIELTRNLP